MNGSHAFIGVTLGALVFSLNALAGGQYSCDLTIREAAAEKASHPVPTPILFKAVRPLDLEKGCLIFSTNDVDAEPYLPEEGYDLQDLYVEACLVKGDDTKGRLDLLMRKKHPLLGGRGAVLETTSTSSVLLPVIDHIQLVRLAIDGRMVEASCEYVFIKDGD